MTYLGNPAPYASTDPGLPFGSAKKPYSIFRRHKGKDYQWSRANITKSRQVFSPITGTIEHIEDGHGVGKNKGEGWGNHVRIRLNKHVVVRLAHFVNGWSNGFKVGQKVNVDDYLAQMGNSGDTNGQVHLHEELLIDGVRVNPDAYRGPRGKHLPGTESATGGGTIPAPKPPAPKPDPEIPEEEDDDMSTRVILSRTDVDNGKSTKDWTLETPSDGLDLVAFDGTNATAVGVRRTLQTFPDGTIVNQYRGFRSTNNGTLGLAWTRMYGYSSGRATGYLNRDNYILSQAQLSALAIK